MTNAHTEHEYTVQPLDVERDALDAETQWEAERYSQACSIRRQRTTVTMIGRIIWP